MTDFEGDYYTEYDLRVMYDDMLDEVYGTVDIGGLTYDTSYALKNVDRLRMRLVGMIMLTRCYATMRT